MEKYTIKKVQHRSFLHPGSSFGQHHLDAIFPVLSNSGVYALCLGYVCGIIQVDKGIVEVAAASIALFERKMRYCLTSLIISLLNSMVEKPPPIIWPWLVSTAM